MGGPGSGDRHRRFRRGRVDPYPLTVRPRSGPSGAAPIVDLHVTLPVAPLGGGTTDAWEHAVGFLRSTSAGNVDPAVATETIKSFDRRRGADQAELDAVLAALDHGRPVAFYGWWPSAESASTTETLGIDAMDVPPPDRKGNGLIDGHAVLVVGYGRHGAFPGGGYLIVSNEWSGDGWGDAGIGYMPFTYLRAYATELCTTSPQDGPALSEEGAGPSSEDTQLDRDQDVVDLELIDIDDQIDRKARCADPRASLTHLFFSEDLIELARARAICSLCPVREACREQAIARREPYGVWGGEMFLDGRIITEKRGRGRPPKVPRPPLVVDEITGVPVVA